MHQVTYRPRDERVSRRSLFTSRRGFTLLELMVAIALIGLIVLILSAAMRLGFRSVASGEQRIDYIERMRTSLNDIEYQIQSQIPLTISENGEKKYLFKGKKDSLEFATNYSIFSGQNGYVMVDYEVKTDDNRKKFLSVSENAVGVSGGGETRLLNIHDDISFEYFSKGPTDEKGDWVDTWTDTTTTPEKVRIHIVDGKRDLATIIPMRAKGSLTQTAAPGTLPAIR
jgi:general secretion pathway protein J